MVLIRHGFVRSFVGEYLPSSGWPPMVAQRIPGGFANNFVNSRRPLPPTWNMVTHLKKVFPSPTTWRRCSKHNYSLIPSPEEGSHLQKVLPNTSSPTTWRFPPAKGTLEDLFSNHLKKVSTCKRYSPTPSPEKGNHLQKISLHPSYCLSFPLTLFTLFFHLGHKPYSTWRKYFQIPDQSPICIRWMARLQKIVFPFLDLRVYRKANIP